MPVSVRRPENLFKQISSIFRESFQDTEEVFILHSRAAYKGGKGDCEKPQNMLQTAALLYMYYIYIYVLPNLFTNIFICTVYIHIDYTVHCPEGSLLFSAVLHENDKM